MQTMSNLSQSPSKLQPVAMMQALYDFTAEESSEMSMRNGDHLEVLDMDPALNGWAYCRIAKGNKIGYVPLSYLRAPNHNNQNRQSKGSKSQSASRSESPGPNNMNNGRNQRGFNKGEDNKRMIQFNAQQQQQIQHQHQQQQQGGKHQQQGMFRGNNSGNFNQRGNRGGNGFNSQNHDTSNMQHHNQQGRNMHSNQSNGQNNNRNGPNQNRHNQPQVPFKPLKPSQLNDQDHKVIVCSFHRDFIPSVDDLHKYFGGFGVVTNQLEIQHDSKRVPLARIRYQLESSADKVCNRGPRQQIPSSSQGGNIHVRVWRSIQQYQNETSKKYRGNGQHHNNRRGHGHNNNRNHNNSHNNRRGAF